jgi:zinc protease
MLRRVLFALLLVLVTLPAGAVTVEKVTSPGGVTAYLVQDHSNPILAMEVAFRAGATQDPKGKAGTANMVAGLLDEGAGNLDSLAFQSKLEDLAIELGFDAGKDHFHGHLKTLTEHRDTAFDMFRLSLTQPRFDKEPVERIRSQILTQLARELSNPDTVAARDFAKAVFAGHPYARAVRGEPETVKTIAVPDLKSFVKSALARDNLYVAVVGDVTPDQLKPLLDATFGGLPAKAMLQPVPEVAPELTGQAQIIERNNPQSTAVFGQAGLKRRDPDWYAAYVMNYILGGGGFSSWLTEEVREKRGLAYSVYSYLQPMDHSALMIGGVATQNARFSDSLKLIRETWARMRDTGPTPKELDDAKTYLTGSFPLQMDSVAAIAGLLVAVQLDDLGLDYLDKRNGYIQAVTADDVRKVAGRLLTPDKLTFTVVGKPGAAQQ